MNYSVKIVKKKLDMPLALP